MMFPKRKRVKLKGKALQKLNDFIHERDRHRCIFCGAPVEGGVKFHHEPCGPDKSDELTKGVILCMACHYERHFGEVKLVKRACEEYLERRYGAV